MFRRTASPILNGNRITLRDDSGNQRVEQWNDDTYNMTRDTTEL